MNIKRFALASLAACTTLTIVATTAIAQLATVTIKALNVRRGAGVNFPVTYVLRQGARVEIVRRQGDWAYVVGEKGGEGWVYTKFLSTSAPGTGSGKPTNDVFKAQGTIDNTRYKGAGQAQLVITRQDKGASLSLSNPGRVSIEYLGIVSSNFEGTVQLQVNRLRSSEMGYRTVPVSGTCDIQASGSVVRQAFCTVKGEGVDHGRSSFKAQ